MGFFNMISFSCTDVNINDAFFWHDTEIQEYSGKYAWRNQFMQ